MQVYAWTVFPLTLWDLVMKVFHSVPNRTDGPKREPRGNPSAVVKPNMHNSIPIKHTNVVPTNIYHIPSNTTHSGPGAMLYVSEDKEAVIKMIINGRSPTMRHVSRTHRVALDWLFDRINLDPKNSYSIHWYQTCLLNPCNVVALLVTSQPVAVDTTVTFFSHSHVLGPSRIVRKQLASSIVHSCKTPTRRHVD